MNPWCWTPAQGRLTRGWDLPPRKDRGVCGAPAPPAPSVGRAGPNLTASPSLPDSVWILFLSLGSGRAFLPVSRLCLARVAFRCACGGWQSLCPSSLPPSPPSTSVRFSWKARLVKMRNTWRRATASEQAVIGHYSCLKNTVSQTSFSKH